MGFQQKRYGLWVLEMYGFFIIFPANQSKNVWVMGKYGLLEVWVIGVSTVLALDKV